MEDKGTNAQVLEHFTNGDTGKMTETVLEALRLHREKTINGLEILLETGSGKFRLKILEILLKDGAPDLIALFINAIRTEKNTLYAKSMILLFKDLRHQEALVALLSMERDIVHELKIPYQRTLGRLLSNFSEQFYMSEFRAGIGDRRRVRFAADMMLRAPHKDYTPFLNELMLTNDLGYRVEAIRVLQELGDKTSSRAIFSLLNHLMKQQKKLASLEEALDTPNREPHTFLADLVQRAGLDWEPSQQQTYLEQLTHDDDQVVDLLIHAFELEGDTARKTRPMIKGILRGAELTTFNELRTGQALSDYSTEIEALMMSSAKTLGALAEKENDADFIPKIERFILPDEPRRDAMIIASLAGLQNEESFELLVEYVNTCDDTDLLERCLDALASYSSEQKPKGIEKLCFMEEDGVLRNKALSLLAKWGQASDLANQLLDHKTLVVRADGIRTAAKHGMQEVYPKILAILENGDEPDSLLVTAIEGLGAFNDPRTVRNVRPLLLPPYTATVRKAALQTLYKGDNGIDHIVKVFLQFGLDKIWDGIDQLLNLVLQSDLEAIDEPVLKQREFWLKLMINDVEGPRRIKVLQLAEQLDIEDPYQARAWVLGLKRTVAQLSRRMDPDEQARTQSLIDKLEDRIRIFSEKAKQEKMLISLVDGVTTSNPYQKVQGLRNLAKNYSPDLVKDKPNELKSIIQAVAEELDHPQPKKENLLKALDVVHRIRHPKLHSRTKKYLHHSDYDIRKAAKKAREMSPNPDFVKPIKKIFIMDDSRYITKQLAKVLARAGFEVDFENAVVDGLDRLATTSFDLLILDIVMPEKSGGEFLLEIRDEGCAPEYTLVITSTRDQEDLQPLIKCGIDGVLLKPFAMDALLEKIKSLAPALN